MNRKNFTAPLILLKIGLDEDEGNETGKGSGQSTPDVVNWTYEEWVRVYQDKPSIFDYDKDGNPGTQEDFEKWKQDHL